MREVFVNIDPFAMVQAVAVVKENLAEPVFSCSLDDLGTKLAEYAVAENVTNIKLYGNEDFSEKIIADFWNKSNELYANQNVKIGVIKE